MANDSKYHVLNNLGIDGAINDKERAFWDDYDNIVGGGSSAWGDLTGTLSNQTDLQTALDAKADSADLLDENIVAAASATNYTPAASHVQGHLAGIDTAIGAIGTVWGDITGTLSNQTDLQAALDAKASADKTIGIIVFESDAAIVTGDGTQGIPISSDLVGYNISDVLCTVHDKGITGTTNVQIRRRRAGANVDVLSTLVTIGDEFFVSDGVVNTSNDDMAEGDILYVDVDTIHSGTAPNGLSVAIQLSKA